MEILALQHDDSNERQSRWERTAGYEPPAPMPTSQASPGLVAHWIHEIELGFGVEFTATSMIKFSRKQGVEPIPVIQALRGSGTV